MSGSFVSQVVTNGLVDGMIRVPNDIIYKNGKSLIVSEYTLSTQGEDKIGNHYVLFFKYRSNSDRMATTTASESFDIDCSFSRKRTVVKVESLYDGDEITPIQVYLKPLFVGQPQQRTYTLSILYSMSKASSLR